MNRHTLFMAVALIASSAVTRAEEEGKSPSSTPSAALAEVRQAIDKGNAQWIAAWDKADASLLAQLFAEDGVLLGRNGKVFKGPQQILERQKPVMEGAGKGVKATVTTVDVWLNGDTAYETGKYSYKFQEKGKPVIEEGRYVTIWKRQSDGSWKIIVDMGIPKG
jgi:uncharacterized protein (TIGR02246 family)